MKPYHKLFNDKNNANIMGHLLNSKPYIRHVSYSKSQFKYFDLNMDWKDVEYEGICYYGICLKIRNK